MKFKSIVAISALLLSLSLFCVDAYAAPCTVPTSTRVRALESKVKSLRLSLANLLGQVQGLRSSIASSGMGQVGPQGPQGERGASGAVNISQCKTRQWTSLSFGLEFGAGGELVRHVPVGEYARVDAFCRTGEFLMNYGFSGEYAPVGQTIAGVPGPSSPPSYENSDPLSVWSYLGVQVIGSQTYSIYEHEVNQTLKAARPQPVALFGAGGVAKGVYVGVKLAANDLPARSYQVGNETHNAEFRLRVSLLCCPL